MKTKYLLLLLAIALPLLSSAQTPSYRSYFGNEFTRWYVYNNMIDCHDWSESYYADNQDTILSNGILYKKIYRSNFAIIRDLYYDFGMREEPATGSLFANRDGDSEELISRMDLEIGDKFYFPSSFYDRHGWLYFEDLPVDDNGRIYATVDSVYYEDDRKHIRFDVIYHAFSFDFPLTFIEGIGPNVSFMPLLQGPIEAVGFNCYENETGLWKSKIEGYLINFFDLEECFLVTGIPKVEAGFPFKFIQQKGKIEIQPNSVDIKQGVATIYSIDGRLLDSKTFRNNANVDFSTSGFPDGVYVIFVRDVETGRAWSKKIIV
jgi:hypothetical protein